MMDIFITDTQIERTIDFDPAAVAGTITITISDTYGNVLFTDTDTVATGDESYTYTVADTYNALSVDEDSRGVRKIEVLYVDSAGISRKAINRYMLESDDGLVEGANTFMVYERALAVAHDLPSSDGWDYAEERKQIAALKEAFNNITTLSFKLTADGEAFNLVLDFTTADLLTLLSDYPDFWNALEMAQIAEADAILGGNEVEDKRRDGLMSETVGESSNMYRPGKPLISVIRTKTLRYLSGYVSMSKRIGRA